MSEEIVQVVTLRVRGSAPGARPPLPTEPLSTPDPSAARLPDQLVWFDAAAPTLTACYDRNKLRAGNRFAGPAVVFQYDATAVMPPGWDGSVDVYRNIWLGKPVLTAG
jgi:N-methylhydantoinase A